MPRLPKAESEKYQAGIAEWTPKVLSVIKELAKTCDNKVKRQDILEALGQGYEDRFTNPIFTNLLALGHISKTGSSRGRGARWGIPADAPQELEATIAATPRINSITVAGPCAHLASAVIRGRAEKVAVSVVEKDADYAATTGDIREIKRWFTLFMKRSQASR